VKNKIEKQREEQKMSDVEKIKEEIAKTEKILAESIEYLKNKPDDYSAKLIVVSTENHLNDLLKKLDFTIMQEGINKNI